MSRSQFSILFVASLVVLALLVITLVVVLIFVIPQMGPSAEPASVPITETAILSVESIYPKLPIAYVFRIKGDETGIGEAQRDGLKIATEYFAERGIVIELTPKDSGDITETVKNFDELNTSDNVLAILGPTFSSEAEEAVSHVKTSGIPVVGISNTKQELIDLFILGSITNYIRLSAPVMDFVSYALTAASKSYRFEKKRELQNVVIAYAINDSFAVSEATAYQKELARLFPKTDVITMTLMKEDTIFDTQVTNILTPTEQPTFPNGLTADLVIVSSLTNSGGLFVKQLKDEGYKGLIIGGNGLNAPLINPSCGLKKLRIAN